MSRFYGIASNKLFVNVVFFIARPDPKHGDVIRKALILLSSSGYIYSAYRGG